MSNTYLVSDLLHSARLCNTSYRPPRAAQDEFFWFTPDCQHIHHVSVDHHRAFLLEFGDRCELILNGRLHLSDFLQQYPHPKLVDASFGNCKLYEFFSEDAERLLCELLSFQDALSMPLHLHGHSLGGSLAALVAVHLQRSGHDVSQATVFGAVRPGDSDFQQVQQSLGLDDRTLKVRFAGQHASAVPSLLLKSLRPTASEPKTGRSGVYLSLQNNRITLSLKANQWSQVRSSTTLNSIGQTLQAFKMPGTESVQRYVQSLEHLLSRTA
ncbi:MAG: thioesterase domain-containing protein [Cyanobacteria bacterium J06648_16]